MTRIKEGLQPSGINRTGAHKQTKNIVGRVYGVVTTENTPTKEMFQKAGGWNGLGSVFYLDYEQSINIEVVDLNDCKIAKPYFSNSKFYPINGELIVLLDLPSPTTQLSSNASQKYYVVPINLWNNNHHNALPAGKIISFGKTFNEKTNINQLQPFEGDYILESRFGAALRFGSTSRGTHSNPWSKIGEEGDPITIITNGLNYDPKSTAPYIEDINSDKSGLYLTSTQTIPLKIPIALNPLTNPIDVDKYTNGQAILLGDRVVINSKKDDVLVFARTNIEFYTRNIINLNAHDRVHINGGRNFIGSKPKGELPDEPLLLGDKTVELLDNILKELCNFASALSSATSTPAGTPLLQINQAAHLLSAKLENIISQTESIKSKQNYTA